MDDLTNSSESTGHLPPASELLAPEGYRRDPKVVAPIARQLGKGRQRGSRNMTTLLRQAVLNKQEDIMLKHLPKIVKLACQMAEKGDLQAMKMIMDRMVPVQKPVDGASAGSGSKQINIIINGSSPVTISGGADAPIEGEFTTDGSDVNG